MAQSPDHLDLLVVRPWLATWRGGEAYAHFDALAMRSEGGRTPTATATCGCSGEATTSAPACTSMTSVPAARSMTAMPRHTPGSGATAQPGARRSPPPT